MVGTRSTKRRRCGMCTLGGTGVFNQPAPPDTVVRHGWRWPVSAPPLHLLMQRATSMWLNSGAISGHTRCIVRGLYHTSAPSLSMQSSGLSNPQNVYFTFGRQCKFTPELYLITAGIFVGSSVSSTVWVLPLSGSSCTRGICLCSSTVFSPISFEPLPPVLLY